MPLPTIPSGNVASAIGGGYEVANSCRFDDGSSSKLSKSISSSGNRKTWTWSAWIKRGNIAGANMDLFGTQYTGLAKGGLYIDTSERLYYSQYESGGASNNVGIRTNRVFRDTSAWYHICLIWDTTDSTGDDRIRLYINGTRETSLGVNTNPSLNLDGVVNLNTHDLFVGGEVSTLFFDGYMCEVVFIDGQALTPDNFGEFDEDTPTVWKPKDVSELTFGTNGFYLDFEDSSNLGNDANGGTDFTESNLAATDQSTDTCTNNFATMNPLHIATSGSPTFSQGNLQIVTPVSGAGVCVSTIGATKGKWYAEVYSAAFASLDRACVGITGDANGTITANTNIGSLTTSLDVGYFAPDGDKFVGNSETSYGASYAVDDIIGIALNIDDNEVTFYKNNSSQGAISFTAGGTYHFALGDVSNGGGSTLVINFGQEGSFAGETTAQGNADGNGFGDFFYSPPSGYYALCTQNLAEFG